MNGFLNDPRGDRVKLDETELRIDRLTRDVLGLTLVDATIARADLHQTTTDIGDVEDKLVAMEQGIALRRYVSSYSNRTFWIFQPLNIPFK